MVKNTFWRIVKERPTKVRIRKEQGKYKERMRLDKRKERVN